MNAKRFLEDAMMGLLKKKSIDKIKVSELIREVGTCKGTFYKYFCDKYDLLLSCFKNRIYTDILKQSSNWKNFIFCCMDTFQKMPTVILNAFNSTDVNSIRCFHENLIIAFFERDLEKRVSEPLSELSRKTMAICVNGYTEILMQWLRNDMNESKEELVMYMCAAIPHSIYAQVIATA